MLKEFVIITYFLFCEALQENFEIITRNQVIVRGYEFSKNDIFQSKNVATRCKCYLLCKESGCCQSFSTKPDVDFGFVCSLSEKLPVDSKLVKSNDESYLSVPVDDFETYWWPDQQSGFYAAQRTCRSKLGYRLGIYKTLEEVACLREFETRRKKDCIHVDMLEVGNAGTYGHYQWNDGTLIKDTEIFDKISLMFHGDERNEEHTFMSWYSSRFDDNVHYRICDVLCFFDPTLFFGKI